MNLAAEFAEAPVGYPSGRLCIPKHASSRREIRSFGLGIRSKLSLGDQDAVGSRPCGASVGGLFTPFHANAPGVKRFLKR
jgi:hypothetical protein